jgi:hypothetical protein
MYMPSKYTIVRTIRETSVQLEVSGRKDESNRNKT